MLERSFIIGLGLLVTSCNVFYGFEPADEPTQTTGPTNVSANNTTVDPPPNNTTVTPPINNTTPPNNTTVNNTVTPPMPLECTADCRCDRDCALACADACDVTCVSGSSCSGNIGAGSTLLCQASSLCEVACTSSPCEVSCKDRDSDCFVDCPDGVACILQCGNRNGQRLADCDYTTCNDLRDCGDGAWACNQDCPVP